MEGSFSEEIEATSRTDSAVSTLDYKRKSPGTSWGWLGYRIRKAMEDPRTRDVCLGLLSGGEDSRGLAHVVGALAGPWDLGGVLGGENVDRRAVHHEVAVAHLLIPYDRYEISPTQ